ncbi:MAG: hypothetical protein KC421_12185, partial [Anaerolineales bacterium]|nr:hypothetical protein [Anaerolineales bacterium]
MKTKNIEDIYELSPLQQGMLFHCLYAPEAEMYVAQRSYMLNGQLNIDAFQYGWQQVINRHTALRTSFHWEKSFDKPLQVVHRHLQQPVDYHDGRHLSPIEQQKLIEACWTKGRKACLEPGQAPLMQLCLIQLADESYEFIWTHHMMLLDGWSVPIIVKEVFSFYEGYSQNLQSSPGLSYPYGNYISWLQQQDLDKAKAFWQHILKGFKNGTVLGIDKAPGQLPDKNDAYDQETIKFNRSLTQKLQSFANEHQLTVNTLVQGAWSLLLSRYSGENDIVYGTTSSGRPATLPGVESMVGLFINTLPVRVQIPAHASLLPWLIQLQKQQIKLREYEYTPLAQIQQWANLSPGKPLFETIVVFENYPVDETTRKHEETLDIKEINAIEKTNYAITLLAGL